MNGLSIDTKQSFLKAHKQKHCGTKSITKTGGLAEPATLQGGFLITVIFAFALHQPWRGHLPALCEVFPATARKLPGNCPDNSSDAARKLLGT
jgi:hypothetical protein